MEERWFKIGDAPPVEEGEMTLRVAKMLAPKLRALGARVSFVRDKTEPVTPYRPEDFKEAARAVLRAGGTEIRARISTARTTRSKSKPSGGKAKFSSTATAKSAQRARLVNARLRPDLVLCLHFNAEAWGDERNPTLHRQESSASSREWLLPAAGARV